MKRPSLILACLMLINSVCTAAPAKPRSELPIELKADQLFSDNNNRTATFTGKVSARQGDITIFADKLVVRYAPETKDVDRVEAVSNVSIIQGNRRAVAQQAVYDTAKGTILLTGNPKVYQGDDTLAAKEITYYVDDQRSTATGGPGERVSVEIHPKGKKGNGHR
jgi:lipopolysaccharide export system protein LptA